MITLTQFLDPYDDLLSKAEYRTIEQIIDLCIDATNRQINRDLRVRDPDNVNDPASLKLRLKEAKFDAWQRLRRDRYPGLYEGWREYEGRRATRLDEIRREEEQMGDDGRADDMMMSLKNDNHNMKTMRKEVGRWFGDKVDALEGKIISLAAAARRAGGNAHQERVVLHGRGPHISMPVRVLGGGRMIAAW